MIVEERNEVLCQEQRVTTARTGILYGCTITDRYRAVFQNQLNRNAFTRLANRSKSRRYRRAGIDEPIVTCAVFNGLLVVKIK
ncbi:hypothetical protein D3C81_2078390 [compost metagenome]